MLKKLVLFPFFLLFTFSLLDAQNYQMSRADSLREEGDLNSAIEAGKARFAENPNDFNNTYNLACNLSLMRNADSAFHYLKIAMDGDTSVRALTDPDFLFISKFPKWEEIARNQIQKVEIKYGKYENLELSKELWRMSMKDQAYYYHIDIAGKKMDRNSPVTWALWDLKQELNSKNLQDLEEIIAEHGWPKSSIVKGSAAQAAFLIVQHADLETQKKYLPMMQKAAENGDASWSSLALLIDRVRMREGQAQLYGSQVIRNTETGAFEPFEIEDPANVNVRRKEVGLGPIEDYLSNWGIEYVVPEKE